MTDENLASDILVRFLHDQSAPCPVCRYNLRGISSRVCPECGCELALRVTSARSVGGEAWLAAGVTGSILSATLAVLPLISEHTSVAHALRNPHLKVLVQQGMVPASELPDWIMIIELATLTTAAIALGLWLVITRRKFFMRPSRQRIIIGAIAALSPFAVIAMLAALI